MPDPRRRFGLEAFFDVPTLPYRTRLGEVALPIRYRDATAVAAIYRVPLDAARAQTRPLGVEPVTVPGGHALAWIVWFDYRETSVGPYHELAVGVLAGTGTPGPLAPLAAVTGRGPTGLAILHLPVTTELAWAAGVDLWGYPKIVTELDYRWSPAALEARMTHEGREVLGMRLPLSRGPALPFPLPDIATLSVHEDTILKTVIHTRSLARLRGGRGVRLAIGDADHPLGRTLADLALPERPTAVLHVPAFRSLLPAGEPLGRAPRAPGRPSTRPRAQEPPPTAPL